MVRMMVAAMAVLAIAAMTAAPAQTVYGAVPNQPAATGGWGPRGWGGPTGPDAAIAPAVLRPDLRGIDRPIPADRRAYDRDWADGVAPGAFSGNYVRPYPGWRLPSYFVTPTFFVRDPVRFGLSAPGPGRNWVRYYDDAVLVGPDGRVDAIRHDVNWSGVRRARGPEVAGRLDYDAGYDDGYADARDDRVTYGGQRDGTYPPGSVVVQGAPGVGTTTVTTVTEGVVYRPVRRTPAPRYRRR